MNALHAEVAKGRVLYLGVSVSSKSILYPLVFWLHLSVIVSLHFAVGTHRILIVGHAGVGCFESKPVC